MDPRTPRTASTGQSTEVVDRAGEALACLRMIAEVVVGLVVVAARQHGALARLVLSSSSERSLAQAASSVLLIPERFHS